MFKSETIEEFIARGGTITPVPKGQSALDHKNCRPAGYNKAMLKAGKSGTKASRSR